MLKFRVAAITAATTAVTLIAAAQAAGAGRRWS